MKITAALLKGKKLMPVLLMLMVAGVCLRLSAGEPYVHIPPTISKEWQDYMRPLGDPHLIPPYPEPGDREGWRKLYLDCEKMWNAQSEIRVKKYNVSVIPLVLGGVAVLDVRPENWKDNGKILIFAHGGGYTLGSAESSRGNAAVMAHLTGLRVISVDYTVAPEGRWDDVTDQVVTVMEALQDKGYSLGQTGIYGDSAGGGLAAGAVLKMRDSGKGMPAAVVLWSPWADITDTGDTYVTLKDAEPCYVYERHLKHCADAYAAPEDQKNPCVSPVYGDYSKGFPPTLIQGGTKEIFLSNYIRLYQALDQAGVTVKLDLYEGMIHDFQAIQPESPEGRAALKKVKQFLERYL